MVEHGRFGNGFDSAYLWRLPGERKEDVRKWISGQDRCTKRNPTYQFSTTQHKARSVAQSVL